MLLYIIIIINIVFITTIINVGGVVYKTKIFFYGAKLNLALISTLN